MEETVVREAMKSPRQPLAEESELAWLGDPKHRPLLNAENLTVTRDGRLFVTGSERVCEIEPDGHGGFRWTDIPLPNDLKAVYRNGIAADDHYLYLACVEVDQEAQPLVRGWLPQLTSRPQDALGFMLFRLALALCPVRSFVLRADLSERPLHFGDRIALTGKCFANGLAVDERYVYAASSVSGDSGIHRLRLGDWTSSAPETTLWYRTEQHAPNGLKIGNKALYYTHPGSPPLFASTLTALTLDDEPKVLNDGLCRQNGVMFDDFDIIDGRFVVAMVGDFANVLGGFSGAIVFFDENGVRESEITDPRIKHPSAVKVLRSDTQFGRAGDLLLTEKDSHTVWRMRLKRSAMPL
jgi:hypothetical protein